MPFFASLELNLLRKTVFLTELSAQEKAEFIDYLEHRGIHLRRSLVLLLVILTAALFGFDFILAISSNLLTGIRIAHFTFIFLFMAFRYHPIVTKSGKTQWIDQICMLTLCIFPSLSVALTKRNTFALVGHCLLGAPIVFSLRLQHAFPVGIAAWTIFGMLTHFVGEADRLTWLYNFFNLGALGILVSFGMYQRDALDLMNFQLKKAMLKEHESKLKVALDAIEQTNQAAMAKSRLVSVISHELRSPCQAILGMCSVLSTARGMEEEDRDCVTLIQRSSDFLVSIVNDVLSLSRLDSDQIHLAKETVILPDLIEDVLDCVSMAAYKSPEVDLVYQASGFDENSGVLVSVLGDAERLKQVFLNLTTNAAKFCKVGTVSITIERASVEDIEQLCSASFDPTKASLFDEIYGHSFLIPFSSLEKTNTESPFSTQQSQSSGLLEQQPTSMIANLENQNSFKNKFFSYFKQKIDNYRFKNNKKKKMDSKNRTSEMGGSTGEIEKLLQQRPGSGGSTSHSNLMNLSVELNARDAVLRSEYMKITVQDTGVGLSPEHLDKVFQEFYMVGSEQGSTFRGTGLGLPIVKKLVLLMGGALKASSKGQGQGTTFTVFLPTGNSIVTTQPTNCCLNLCGGDHSEVRIDMATGYSQDTSTSSLRPYAPPSSPLLPSLAIPFAIIINRFSHASTALSTMLRCHHSFTQIFIFETLKGFQQSCSSNSSNFSSLLPPIVFIDSNLMPEPDLDLISFIQTVFPKSKIILISPAQHRISNALLRSFGFSAKLSKPIKREGLKRALEAPPPPPFQFIHSYRRFNVFYKPDSNNRRSSHSQTTPSQQHRTSSAFIFSHGVGGVGGLSDMHPPFSPTSRRQSLDQPIFRHDSNPDFSSFSFPSSTHDPHSNCSSPVMPPIDDTSDQNGLRRNSISAFPSFDSNFRFGGGGEVCSDSEECGTLQNGGGLLSCSPTLSSFENNNQNDIAVPPTVLRRRRSSDGNTNFDNFSRDFPSFSQRRFSAPQHQHQQPNFVQNFSPSNSDHIFSSPPRHHHGNDPHSNWLKTLTSPKNIHSPTSVKNMSNERRRSSVSFLEPVSTEMSSNEDLNCFEKEGGGVAVVGGEQLECQAQDSQLLPSSLPINNTTPHRIQQEVPLNPTTISNPTAGTTINGISTSGSFVAKRRNSALSVSLSSSSSDYHSECQQKSVNLKLPKILIVEDNEINQRVWLRILRDKYSCDVVASGETALQKVEENEYTCILMDFNLEGMNGVETAKHIRTRADEKSHVPIVGLSGDLEMFSQEAAISASIDEFLAKPVRPEALLSAIQRVTSHRCIGCVNLN